MFVVTLNAKLANFSEIRAVLSEENAKGKSLYQMGYSLGAEICAVYSSDS